MFSEKYAFSVDVAGVISAEFFEITEEEHGKLKYKGVTLNRKQMAVFEKINEIVRFLNG